MSDQVLKNTHIVVADGLADGGRAIERFLVADGYEHVNVLATGAEVVALCANMWVDLLILDLAMPDMDGFEIIEALTGVMSQGRLRVLINTAQGEKHQRYRALSLGVRDFINDPGDAVEVCQLVRATLTTSALEGELIAKNVILAGSIASRAEALTRARLEILVHLAVAAEFRDDSTHEHTLRVARTAVAIAGAWGLEPAAVRMIAAAAPLHDIGKIGIPDTILLKRGRHTEREQRIMRTHVRIGAAILSHSEVPELQLAESIALGHHEHWDGNGYPSGIAGAAIPTAARIVAIADAFDALVFERPYKAAWSVEAAVVEIDAQRSRQFDPELVEVFLRLNHEDLRSPIDSQGAAKRLRGVIEAETAMQPDALATNGAHKQAARAAGFTWHAEGS
jgi:putative two-component system response regulator